MLISFKHQSPCMVQMTALLRTATFFDVSFSAHQLVFHVCVSRISEDQRVR